MNKILYSSLIAIFLVSCVEPKDKPFIVIGKKKWNGYDSYRFVDKNGVSSCWFEDKMDKYNVGDTLK